jgi:enoyl-CoA hydratase/carnithine racemase
VLASGNQKVFCAGSDIKEFPDARKDVIERKLKLENEAYNMIEQIDKPVIAAVEGIAYGGGAELALACDLRIVGETAKFAFPEITLGVVPGTGGMFRLSKAVGLAKAREMMYLGEPIAAEEALRWGLINRVVPAGCAAEVALELAVRIAAKSTLALATIKLRSEEMLLQNRDECFWSNLAMSDTVFRSDACAEGVDAFISKRAPDFHKKR